MCVWVCYGEMIEKKQINITMKFSSNTLFLAACAIGSTTTNAFTPSSLSFGVRQSSSKVVTFGYLDDLTADLYAEEDTPDVEGTTHEATDLAEDKKDRYSVGDWSSYVEFDEFDGGDGQMGVAGDGNKKLEGFDQTQLVKSKQMSAKNAWGTSTGYREKLISEGMEETRAQQMENWNNQREVQAQRDQQKYLTNDFDTPKSDEDDQWSLGKFGVERNQDFDMDAAFGAVEVGDITETIELTGRMGGAAGVHEFGVKNEYMGFADFRASFVAGTPSDWSVEPTEGSLSKEATQFLVRFRPNNPGMSEGYLVIETEDFKNTYKLIGNTA